MADSDPRYRIHEFAELAGVTVKTLHHYDRLGLLRPERTAAGYRVYRSSDLVRVEQILALKAIGLALKDIRTLLERGTLPLAATFRQQREVLEEKRVLIDRAIRALADAERAIEAGHRSTTEILQEVISIMNMQDGDVMRKYYSDEAWAQWQHHYEDWPSTDWQTLYRDVVAVLDMDPAAPHAQALADRWLALTKADQATSPAVRTGLMKAWADRDHWPAPLKRRITEFDIERATKYISEALWIRWDAQQQARSQRGGPGVPRVTDSRRELFHEWLAILDTDTAGEAAQALVAKSEVLLDSETNGDEEIKADIRSAFYRRHSWPAGMKRYIASLYDTDAETWSRVNDFIERALAYTPSGGTPSRQDAWSSPRSGESA